MAPRTVKSKKTETKLADSAASKKVRGKVKKIVEVEEECVEISLADKIEPQADKKIRGRKGGLGEEEQVNEEEIVNPIKKSRKKKEPTPEQNDIPLRTDRRGSTEDDSNQPESNATSEVHTTDSKGRKKQPRNQIIVKDSKDSINGKKTRKQESDNEGNVPKTSKVRDRKVQPKVVELPDEVVNSVSTTRGKKNPAKVVNVKNSAETEEAEPQIKETPPGAEETLKKGRGRKFQTKPTKDKANENEKHLDEHSEDDEEPAAKKTKHEVGKGEPKDEQIADAKPIKSKRGRKPAEVAPGDQETQDTAKTSTKRRRKPHEEQDQNKKKVSPKNKNTTHYESIEFSNSSKNAQGKEWNFKICSWNVDGIRAWLGKGGLDYIAHEKPDILCLQEVKCSQEKLPEEIANVPGYHAYWVCSEQDGYAGVGVYTSRLAMSVQRGLREPALDADGRLVTAEYEQFYLVCVYVPNAGRKLVTLPKRLHWNDAFRKYVKELDMKKPVIICGDMNVAHHEIDLANPKSNRKNAGFTEEERSGMSDLLGDGFIDTFRHFYPDKPNAYTFWTYMMNSRAKNVGWRLDYFIVSERLLPSLCDNVIREQVYGSDHCPIALFLHLTSADKPKEENELIFE